MEKVGIIFAMEEELLALKEYLVLEKEYNIFIADKQNISISTDFVTKK